MCISLDYWKLDESDNIGAPSSNKRRVVNKKVPRKKVRVPRSPKKGRKHGIDRTLGR